MIGLEYSFTSLINAPLSLSIDYKPAFNILSDTGFRFKGIAATVRWTF